MVPQDQETTLGTWALSSSRQVLTGLLVVRHNQIIKPPTSSWTHWLFFHSEASSDHWLHLHQAPLLSKQAAAMVAQIRQANKPPPGQSSIVGVPNPVKHSGADLLSVL